MKLTEERLLNAGFNKLVLSFGEPDAYELIVNSFRIRINKHAIVTIFDTNGDYLLQLKANSKKELNKICYPFVGHDLNFDTPKPQSPYKGHEQRIKELEEEVKELKKYIGIDRI